METIESLKRKIDVLQGLREVVKTMKTIAAVGIRQYEKAAESLRLYTRTIEMGVQIALRGPGEKTPPAESSDGRLGTIVFGSEFGMCGQFNESIASHSIEVCRKIQAEWKAVSIIAVGARVCSRLEDDGARVETCVTVPGSLLGITSRVQEMLLKVESWQSTGVERVLLFYNRMVSGGTYRPQNVTFLPIDAEWLESLERKPWPSRVLPAFTMERPQLLQALLGQHLFYTLYRAFTESLAAENAARLSAMQAAGNNIEDRLGELRLEFNQLRQSAITEELLDIVTGFEALTRKD